MTEILALWAVPRSVSTAFERMMDQRGDFDVLHEPFGPAWYFGDEWRCPPQRHVEERPGLTYRSVHEDLLVRAERGPVFIKDFVHYIWHMAEPEMLAAYRHTFLIRDPALTLPSMWDKWPDTDLSETGYAEQRALFDHAVETTGEIPPVIDAEDLLDDPAGVTEAWCDAVGIPFLPAALSWATSPRENHSWWESGSWHEKLGKSTGLTRQTRAYGTVDDDPRLRELHDVCAPHYAALHPHRLGA